MKMVLYALSLLLGLLLVTGCATDPPGSVEENTIPQDEDSTPGPDSSTNPQEPLPLEQWEVYNPILSHMRDSQSLYQTWTGNQPDSVSDDVQTLWTEYAVTAIARQDTLVTLTVAHYSYGFLSIPVEDSGQNHWAGIEVRSEGNPYSPLFLTGMSEVTLEQTGNSYHPVSCRYDGYDVEAVVAAYLQQKTDLLAEELSASERLDTTTYDPRMVDYIWRTLAATRYIAAPEDITLYDLENYNESLSINPYVMGWDITEEPFVMDGSLLELMTGLEEVEVSCKLEDYSVFNALPNLRRLVLYGMTDLDMATLRAKGLEELHLRDLEIDVLDLSNVNTDALHLSSWTSAVSRFTGCEDLKRLYVRATRTDTALINAENFPGATYLNLYFYSDTERIRNLSGLATFDPDVVIDVYLDYQACNNETVKSLEGAHLRDLILNPDNGSYPLQDFDPSLADALNAQNVTFGMELYFEERLG